MGCAYEARRTKLIVSEQRVGQGQGRRSHGEKGQEDYGASIYGVDVWLMIDTLLYGNIWLWWSVDRGEIPCIFGRSISKFRVRRLKLSMPRKLAWVCRTPMSLAATD